MLCLHRVLEEEYTYRSRSINRSIRYRYCSCVQSGKYVSPTGPEMGLAGSQKVTLLTLTRGTFNRSPPPALRKREGKAIDTVRASLGIHRGFGVTYSCSKARKYKLNDYFPMISRWSSPKDHRRGKSLLRDSIPHIPSQNHFRSATSHPALPFHILPSRPVPPDERCHANGARHGHHVVVHILLEERQPRHPCPQREPAGGPPLWLEDVHEAPPATAAARVAHKARTGEL